MRHNHPPIKSTERKKLNLRYTPIVLAFGSNMGSRENTIRHAQKQLASHPQIVDVRPSPLRESIAVTVKGPDPTQPAFLNGVATALTSLDPYQLLELLKNLERSHGRVSGKRWQARPLDIDIIHYGGIAIADEKLTVPHPRAHERDFVLSPWLALEPQAVLAGHGKVATLLAELGDTTKPWPE